MITITVFAITVTLVTVVKQNYVSKQKELIVCELNAIAISI